MTLLACFNAMTEREADCATHSSKAESAFSIPWVRDLLDQVFSFLRENTEWLGLRAQNTTDSRPVKLLDYACGSGIASTVSTARWYSCPSDAHFINTRPRLWHRTCRRFAVSTSLKAW